MTTRSLSTQGQRLVRNETSNSNTFANNVAGTGSQAPLSVNRSANSQVGNQTIVQTNRGDAVSWTTTAVENIQAVTFMRQRVIRFDATACKPNTRLYPFFDDTRIDPFIRPAGKALGAPIITDANGAVSGEFFLPGNRFPVGTRTFVLTQNAQPTFVGGVTGEASATFQSFGYAQSIRTTTNNLSLTVGVNENIIENVVVLPPPPVPLVVNVTNTTINPTTVIQTFPNRDPLAQSFNTFGLKDGIFITSIELYFATKSATEPVIFEVRTMANGYPTDTLVGSNARVVKPASEIVTSSDASVATKFTFPYPLYLEPNAEYCFVAKPDSQDYNVFVSEMGQISLETKRMITEQPYLGSLFKSQNNLTWVAEQYKDIKFKINRARFNIGTPTLVRMAVEPVHVYIPSTSFTTTSGSPIITVDMGDHKHGLTSSPSSRVVITPAGYSSVYNGITSANLTGTRVVSAVIDDYRFQFLANSNATTTGSIASGGVVGEISIDSGGAGYTDAEAAPVTISGGGGSNAAATATIIGGRVTKINITNRGTGYTSSPTVTIGSAGIPTTPAILTADIGELFLVEANNISNMFISSIDTASVSGTEVTSSIRITGEGYTSIPAPSSFKLKGATFVNNNALIASRTNENILLGNNDSTVVTAGLVSTSEYVSPILFLDNATVNSYAFHINNQDGETISPTVTNGTTSVQSITITDPSTTYSSIPLMLFDSPGYGGTAASAVVELAGQSVGNYNNLNGGSGYTTIPNIEFSYGFAKARANMVPWNSEITPGRGNALSRLITNVTKLQTPSTSVIVYVDAYSGPNSSFDVYFRSTLSTDNKIHADQDWKLMVCDVERNKSSQKNQLLEYKFTLDELPEYDTFDLKIVLRSSVNYDPPIISNYRLITAV